MKETRVVLHFSLSRRLGVALALVALAALVLGASPSQTPTVAAASSVDAKIEIVWPHNNASVSAANQANITAYLFESGGLTPINADFDKPVTLWAALNSDPAKQVGTGTKRMADVNGTNMPVWDFNDVDVSAAKNPDNKYYFFLTVDGFPYAFNVWGHGVDGRTILPEPYMPNGVGPDKPSGVDARISILYPHDKSGAQRDVRNAELGNLTVRLFQPGTANSVGPNFNNKVKLLRMINNGPAEVVAEGKKRTFSEGSVVHPVWDFNDVDINLARNPANKIYFTVQVEGVQTFPTIWSHASDARTILPRPDVPVGQVAQAAPPGAAVANPQRPDPRAPRGRMSVM